MDTQYHYYDVKDEDERIPFPEYCYFRAIPETIAPPLYMSEKEERQIEYAMAVDGWNSKRIYPQEIKKVRLFNIRYDITYDDITMSHTVNITMLPGQYTMATQERKVFEWHIMDPIFEIRHKEHMLNAFREMLAYWRK